MVRPLLRRHRHGQLGTDLAGGHGDRLPVLVVRPQPDLPVSALRHEGRRPAAGRELSGRGRGREVPILTMRIATWNVNSLNARLEKVQWWLDRARPDVL